MMESYLSKHPNASPSQSKGRFPSKGSSKGTTKDTTKDYHPKDRTTGRPYRKPNYDLINYINSNYDIQDLYYQVTGHHAGNGKCYCCFHPNHDTPAAKIYGNVLKCFGECNRVYGPYDFLKTFYPEQIDKIKSSVIIPKAQESKVSNVQPLSRTQLNLTAPITDIISTILVHNAPDSEIANLILSKTNFNSALL